MSSEEPAAMPMLVAHFVAVQLALAAQRCIPRSTVALGVRMVGSTAEVIFRLNACSAEDWEDVEEIMGEFAYLLSDYAVQIDHVVEVVNEHQGEPNGPVLWMYVAREPGDA